MRPAYGRCARARIAALGIEQALVTCADTNIASRRVIEACGGTLWQERDGILRFWLPT